MVKKALHSKSIQSLRMLDVRISASELVDLISSFTSGTAIRDLAVCHNTTFSAEDFVQQLPAQQWKNLHILGMIYNSSLSISDPLWRVILRLPILFPHLTHLSLCEMTDNHFSFVCFDPNMVVALVDSYSDLLDDENTNLRGSRLTLRFKSNAANRKIILGSLVADHRCSCDPDIYVTYSYTVRRGRHTGIMLQLDG